MRFLILFIILINTFHAFAEAESLVTKNCAKAIVNSVPPAFTNFATVDQRRANPDLYVQAVETVISSSRFKSLLDCRDRLKANPQFKYNLRFLSDGEGRMMSVTRSRPTGGMMAQASIELTFDLKSSPQKLLFVYIHELTHVCQALNWAELQAKFDIVDALPKIFSGGMTMISNEGSSCECLGSKANVNSSQSWSQSDIKDDYFRHRKLGEVEAFYNMTKAYQYFTGIDSSFCRGTKDDGSANLYKGYLEMEGKIDQGYFAQDIIVKYHEKDSNQSETANALFDSSSPDQLYPDGVLRPTLNRHMLKLIKDLGLPIVEPIQKKR